MQNEFVRLEQEGLPQMVLYKNGTVINTKTGRTLTNNDINGIECCTGKKVSYKRNMLLNKYFFAPWFYPEKQFRLLGFLNCSGYAITEDGVLYSIRSHKYVDGVLNTDGYLKVTLQTNESKNWYTTKHRLVALAFVPNPENKPEVNHKDGVKTHNHYSNLEWVHTNENLFHMYDTGLKQRTISNEQIHEVCKMLEQKCRHVDIVAKVGCKRYHISDILAGMHARIANNYNFKRNKIRHNLALQ